MNQSLTQADENFVVLKTQPGIEGQTFPGYSGDSPDRCMAVRHG